MTKTVYCDDSHERWDAATFLRSPAGPWIMAPIPGRRERVDARAVFDLHTGRRLSRAEAKYVESGLILTNSAAEFAARYRFRYNLYCDKCGLNVPARGEHLAPILDTLAKHNIPDITLTALAGRVRNRTQR